MRSCERICIHENMRNGTPKTSLCVYRTTVKPMVVTNGHHNNFSRGNLKNVSKSPTSPNFVYSVALLSTICLLNKRLHYFREDVLNLTTIGGSS